VASEDDRPRDAVYLHYLDRELNDAAGRRVSAFDSVRTTRLLALMTQSELYCGLSALWENDLLNARALADFELLFSLQQLQTVSSDVTRGEFLDSRRDSYMHDQLRYPNYFAGEPERLLWSHPTWQKRGGSTVPLSAYLMAWAERSPTSGRFTPTALAVQGPVRETLSRRDGQAITYALFQPALGDLHNVQHARYVIRRRISSGFTEDYLRHGVGTIATGIPELEAFDELAGDYPIYDTRLLGEICAMVGLGPVVDPFRTDVEIWRDYVLARSSVSAQLLGGTVRWVLAGLNDREGMRKPKPRDDAERFYDQHPVRTRISVALREAARVAERPAAPSARSVAEEGIQKAQQRLLWIAERLGANDSITKAILDETRGSIGVLGVDVVLTTVNDIETDALIAALEGAGYRGRPEMGATNTYWIYGPIGGTTVAHVRSSMGSSGQGGSTLTTIDAIRDLRPSAILGVGVAFGVDETKQPIGMLLLSERLTEYEKTRVGMDSQRRKLTLSRGPSSEASPRLLGRFRDARLGGIGIEVQAGEMLSGEKLIDNPAFKAELLKRFPEAIGGEMEGAGVQAASGREGIDWLVVKAVCDYAQEKAVDKKRRQVEAATRAARAVLYVLEQGGLRRRDHAHFA
jgi:nucleoside phosphorylase